METLGYEQPASRIDTYIAALLQGAVERGMLSVRYDDDVSPDDLEVIELIVKLAAGVNKARDGQFECEANK